MRNRFVLFFPFYFGILLFLSIISANDSLLPYYNYNDTLLVCNKASPESMEICSYFLSKRPSLTNVTYLNGISTQETIDCTMYNSLLGQIKQYLDGRKDINYIVTTKGVPLILRCPIDSSQYVMSVDSMLSVNLTGVNPVRGSYAGKEEAFSSERERFYIVTRLTGYNLDDVKKLIDNSGVNVAEENVISNGRFVIDETNYQIGLDNYFLKTKNLLDNKGYKVIYINASDPIGFLREAKEVIGYISWGSNDRNYIQPILGNWDFTLWKDMENPLNWLITSGKIFKSDFIADPGFANSTTSGVINQPGRFEIEQVYESSFVAERRFYYLINYAYKNFRGNVSIGFDSLDEDNRIISSYNFGLVSLKEEESIGNLQSSSFLRHYPSLDAVKIKVYLIVQLEKGEFYIDNIDIREIAPTFDWKKGAIGITAVSTSARSFSNTTSYGQSLVADLIYDGISGIEGFVFEPGLGAVADSTILFDRYTKGYNLGDSFYMASTNIYNRDVIVGDPKTFIVFGTNLTGIITVPENFYLSSTLQYLNTLHWDDMSSIEDGFIIERAEFIDGPWTEIGRTGINEESYSFQGPTSILNYYRIRAFNTSLGYSIYTEPILFPAQQIETSIGSCQVLNTPNYYNIIEDIVPSGSSACILISAPGITLDCNSHYFVNSSYKNKVIYAENLTNITIKNCQIKTNLTDTNSQGISLTNVSNSFILNNSINSNLGISIMSGNSNYLTGNKGSNSNIGISIFSSNLNYLIENNFSSSNIGFLFSISAQNYIFNNTLSYNGDGIDLLRAVNNTVYGNSLNYNRLFGVLISFSDWNNITNNLLYNNSFAGIFIQSSNSNILINNSISKSKYGIIASIPSSRGRISNNLNSFINNILDMNNYGLYINSSNATLIEGGTINNSSLGAIVGFKNKNVTLKNISFSKNISSYDIFFSDTDGLSLINLNSDRYNIKNISRLSYIKDKSGIITFLTSIDSNGTNLSEDIIIKGNYAFVNSSRSGLNKSANITLQNIPTNILNAQILANNKICNSTTIPICVNYTSLNAGNVSFMVSEGGVYMINFTINRKCEDFSYEYCPSYCIPVKPPEECGLLCIFYSNGTVLCPTNPACDLSKQLQCITKNLSGFEYRELESCGTINKPGTYILNKNISGFSNEGCIIINSSDVSFNCLFNSIEGSRISGAVISVGGLYTNLKNITIKNCRIRPISFSRGVGIRLMNVNDSLIIGNNLSNNYNGILLTTSNKVIINNNEFNSNFNGISLIGKSNSNTIQLNSILNNFVRGIMLTGESSGNVISLNKIASNGDSGLFISSGSVGNNVIRNVFENNKNSGIIVLSNGNKINSNTIINNKFYGIILSKGGDNTVLFNNKVTFNDGYGIYISSYKNIIASNFVYGNNKSGILLINNINNISLNGLNSTLYFNIVTNNLLYGIELISTVGNKLDKNKLDYNVKSGLFLNRASGNSISNGNSSNNMEYGIFIINQSNSNLVNMIARANKKGVIFDDGINVGNNMVIN
ncbi:right-handed parallel beta-helix repeat-containing protein [Candidatus Pacearchaeota archaeon]|nr:right-handed parallel beta-helix repeat-containing protein [Candidatus Pacearchaeota archaeon]